MMPAISRLSKKWKLLPAVLFPASYVQFLQQANGGEGQDDSHGYIYIWKCENLIQYNKDYQVQKYLSQSVNAFAMDGDKGYFFDCRWPGEPAIISSDFGDLDISAITHEADSFEGFIRR